MTDVIAFTKVALPYGWLGNMAPFPVTHDGLVWRTTEALFQALRFDDRTIRELIRAERSPMGAKFVAKGHAPSMVIDPTGAADVGNMKRVCRLKLQQHPELVPLLRETGDRQIIEDVTGRQGGRHRFWGAALVDGVWVGDNVLGKIWMELRGELT